ERRQRPVAHAGTGIAYWQVQRESTADPGGAAQLDLAAEQVRQLAADRETKPGAAVTAAGAGVGLLEGLEDDPLLFRQDADAGIRHLEGDDRRGIVEDGMVGAPTPDHLG